MKVHWLYCISCAAVTSWQGVNLYWIGRGKDHGYWGRVVTGRVGTQGALGHREAARGVRTCRAVQVPEPGTQTPLDQLHACQGYIDLNVTPCTSLTLVRIYMITHAHMISSKKHVLPKTIKCADNYTNIKTHSEICTEWHKTYSARKCSQGSVKVCVTFNIV